MSPSSNTEVNQDQWTQWLNGLSWTPVDGSEFKKLSNEEKLTRIRHSASHVMASAIMEIRPDARFATGPATPQGFFYDVKTDESLRAEDLADLEERIQKIAGRSIAFETAEAPKDKAIEYFKAMNQTYKLEVIEKLPVETLTLYRHGDFVDLCAGPHVPHTGLCRNMKLMGLSAVHWKDELTPSLTRVMGTAWQSDKDLKRYMEFLDEAKRRDHRTLGPQLELFSFHPWAAAAMWHPKGVTVRNLMMDYWRAKIFPRGYVEIFNPLMYRKELFECSGHWDHFQENMFIFQGKHEADSQTEAPTFALKPMNCPDTMLFYKSKLRSYRDLPFRVAEGQLLHRNEASGALHGLMRTRMFSQDDAHIFVGPEHIQGEMKAMLDLIDEVYADFQLEYNIHLSTRPEEYLGEIAEWDQAEEALKGALSDTGRPYILDEGEGAFYGPKIDVYIMDSLGRQWQCGTVQLDFQLPQRFELEYIAPDGSAKRPIVIHRAVFGSFERFLGILIEHLGGAFPTWLAPIQAAVLPIADRHIEYAQKVTEQLMGAGIRAEVHSDESVNYRVRQAEMQKIPYMLVVGDREAEEGTVSIRQYFGGKKGTKSIDDMVAELQEKVTNRQFDVEIKDFGDLFRKPSESISTEGADY